MKPFPVWKHSNNDGEIDMPLSNKIPLIAGNWKMFMTIPEAIDLVNGILSEHLNLQGSEVVVLPPFTALRDVIKLAADTPLQVGAQNLHPEDRGAFTGEVSGPMLRDVGCTYVVVGHSERRQLFGDTNAGVNRKLQAALSQSLLPILCIGETKDEREGNRTLEVIQKQLEECLAGLDSSKVNRVIFAYEPIWAIGTGLTASPEQAQEVHAFIRRIIAENYGNTTAACAIILYGGSVKPDNAFSLLKEKDINGALVGGAALKPDSFVEIIKEAIKAYKEKQ